MTQSEPTYETTTSRVWHLRTGDASAGEVHEQRVEYHPSSPFPPTHYHPHQDEHFEIESGAMLFVVDGEERVVNAGRSLDIPRGTPHQARNASSTEPALVRWETRPALRTTEFFLAAAALGDEAGLLESALLAHEYQDVFRLSGPLRPLVPVVAGFSRLLGMTLPGPGPHKHQ